MKKIGRLRYLFVLLGLSVFAMIANTFAEGKSVKQVYDESVKLYQAAKYQEALKGFDSVVRKAPKFVHARSYAAKCREAIAEGRRPTQSIEPKLAALVIPSIEFEETDLGAVFQYLSQKSEELSGGKVVANFIYKGTDAQKDNTLVTLKLRSTPITRVIDYVGQLTQTKFSYDEFAVVAKPLSEAPAVTNANVGNKDDLFNKFD